MSFTPKGVQFLYNADLDTGPALWINGTPTGFTDSYVGSLSVAFKYQQPHLVDSERYPIFVSEGRDFQLLLPAADEAALGVERAFLMLEIGTPIGSDWAITIDCPGLLDGECHHLQISWDANHATTEKLVTAAWDGAPATVLENDDGTRDAELVRMGSITSFSVGMWPAYQSQATLSMAEFYLQNAAYIDFSSQANIDKFYQSDTGFADLGADGSTPTGSQPLMYYSVRSGGAANDFLNNRGSSDDLTNGAGFGSDPLILVDVFCPEGDGGGGGGGPGGGGSSGRAGGLWDNYRPRRIVMPDGHIVTVKSEADMRRILGDILSEQDAMPIEDIVDAVETPTRRKRPRPPKVKAIPTPMSSEFWAWLDRSQNDLVKSSEVRSAWENSLFPVWARKTL